MRAILKTSLCSAGVQFPIARGNSVREHVNIPPGLFVGMHGTLSMDWINIYVQRERGEFNLKLSVVKFKLYLKLDTESSPFWVTVHIRLSAPRELSSAEY